MMEKIQEAQPLSYDVSPNSEAPFTIEMPWWLYKHDEKPIDEFFNEEPTIWHKRLTRLANDVEINRGVRELVPEVPKHLQGDIARVATHDYLTSCYAPVCNIKKELSFSNRHGAKIERLDACSYAENAFLRTFDAMKMSLGEDTDQESYYDGIGWTIVVDKDDRPVAVKKFVGQHTALSLVPFTVDNRAFPAGSLFRLSLKKKPPVVKGVHAQPRSITPTTNVKEVKFLRLTAFAHNPQDRGDIFEDFHTWNPTSCLSLDEITELASQSIAISNHLDVKSPLIRKLMPRSWNGYFSSESNSSK